MTSIAEVIDNFDVIGIDMPIGLPIETSRHCDIEARRYLRPRGATVFATPPRACIDAGDYADACAMARIATGKAISIQTWNIVPKIREIDAAVTRDLEHRVAEIHPECSFLMMRQTMMNDTQPLDSKHIARGREQRVDLVRRFFALTPVALRGARLDDVLDAYAVLWSTERFARSTHQTMPVARTQRDARGIAMRIVV
jgi:predicted RNase H-like nuclease